MARRARFTKNDLDHALNDINVALKPTGHYLKAASRNGYTGLDLYSGDGSLGHGGKCLRNIECGTPRECLEAANNYRDGVL